MLHDNHLMRSDNIFEAYVGLEIQRALRRNTAVAKSQADLDGRTYVFTASASDQTLLRSAREDLSDLKFEFIGYHLLISLLLLVDLIALVLAVKGLVTFDSGTFLVGVIGTMIFGIITFVLMRDHIEQPIKWKPGFGKATLEIASQAWGVCAEGIYVVNGRQEPRFIDYDVIDRVENKDGELSLVAKSGQALATFKDPIVRACDDNSSDLSTEELADSIREFKAVG